MSLIKNIFCVFIFIFFTPLYSQSSNEYPVVYGISPLYLSYGHSIKGFEAIRRRLPEIQALGANIIWLQPITPPFEEDGHGYDVMEYKKVWSALGTENEFKRLVKDAHAKKIKVMLDVVLNHSSEEHPFVKDIAIHGKKSPYYDFYQQEKTIGVPYSHFQNNKQVGNGNFVYYFWPHLLNFNYQSEALRTYMKDALSHWIQEFDVDGFRFDASWGPSSRYPKFYPEISRHLRKLKPNLILMAEDMTGYPIHYKNSNHPHLKNSGFDWAYDWNNHDPHWISKWSFQTGEEQGETLFNLKDGKKAAELFLSIVKYSENKSGILPVRYIENNDTPGFLLHHSLSEAIWAAKVMFTLPGVPLIFYGQETGNKHELFQLPSFDPNKRMSTYHPKLWSFYQEVIALRKSSSALSVGKIIDVKIARPGVIHFTRVSVHEKVEVELDFRKKKVLLNSIEI